MEEMLTSDIILSINSLLVGILVLAMGIYVFRKNPYMPVGRAFFVVMIFFFIATVSAFWLPLLPPQQIVLLAQIEYFFTVLLFGGFLYLASMLPYEKSSNWFRRQTLTFSIMVTFTAFIAILPIRTTQDTELGSGAGETLVIVTVLCFVIATQFMLYSVRKRTKDKAVRKQVYIMAFAVGFPVLYGLGIVVLSFFFPEFPAVLSPGLMITAIIFMYAVLRNKMFTVFAPQRFFSLKRSPANGAEPHINGVPEARAILVEGKEVDAAYRPFVEVVAAGSPSLLISRTHPDALRERYRVYSVPIIWLATQPGLDHVDPSNLSILQYTITEFLKKNKSSVVMLDGIEYIISNNEMDRVLRFIYNLRDEVIMSESELIIPLDPDVLEINSLAILERELEVVRSGRGAGTGI